MTQSKSFTRFFTWSWIRDFWRSFYLWKFRIEWDQWVMLPLMHVPGRTGSWFRKKLLGFQRCGEKVYIGDHVWFRQPGKISIGNDVRIWPMCFLDASGGIEIGNHVGLSAGSHIYSQNHGYRDRRTPYYDQTVKLAKVVIEDDVWVGAGVMILAGVTLREGTIVAAGSVVTRDSEPYSVIAGVPARKIGQRE